MSCVRFSFLLLLSKKQWFVDGCIYVYVGKKKLSFSLFWGEKNGTLIRTDTHLLSLVNAGTHTLFDPYLIKKMAKYYPDIAKGAKGTRALFLVHAFVNARRESAISLSLFLLFFFLNVVVVVDLFD